MIMIVMIEKCQEALSSGESFSEGMEKYIHHHGRHFNEKLLEFAVGNMETKEGTLEPITLEEWRRMESQYGIVIDNGSTTEYDELFAANMCKADYLGSSIADDFHLCRYVKDVLDDADGYESIVFDRWLADCRRKNVHIEWCKYL